MRAVLALIALLPLGGLVWYSVDELEEAAAHAATAALIEEAAPELAALALLDSQLSTESYWAGAMASAGALGVPIEFVEDILGFDMVQRRVEAEGQVDAMINELALEELIPSLEVTRAIVADTNLDSVDISRAYDIVKSQLDQRISTALFDLTSLSAQVPGTEQATRSVEALDLAVALRESASGIATGYFEVRYPAAATETTAINDLVRDSVIYENQVTRLSQLAEEERRIRLAWEALRSDPLVIDLLERVESSTGAVVSVEPGASLTTEVNLATIDIEAESAAFLDSLTAVARHVEFVDAAADALSTAAADIRAGASDAQRDVIVTTGVVAALTLVAVAGAGWWIVRPLRRMADVASALREGELGHQVAAAGPHEVRTAAAAINEAAVHLKLAEQQAAALANEDLDHESLGKTAPGELGASLQNAVQHLAASLAERERFRARLEHEATHDGLTGLINRSAAMDSLHRSLARVRRGDDDLAVLFIDIDEFKQINDRFGHNVGDRVLCEIADRIGAAIRDGDLACRLGGDEFLVIAEPVRDAEDALTVAERILQTIAQPILVDQLEITPTVSVGVAMAADNTLSPDELLRDADLAVYRAKDLGRGRVEICDLELRGDLAHRMDVEAELRHALSSDQLVLHYQAVVDALSGDLVSMEALVRWDRPGVGLVKPEDFVPIAERSRLIVALDLWVLRALAAQLAEWSDHPILGSVPVAMNLSARHLGEQTLAADFLEALSDVGVAPARLTLEITESALLQDLDAASAQLEVLRSAGVQVALDDFGTGYSSLAHLRQLPVDVLKIDQSFIHNLDRTEDRSLVKLIVETGHLLGASVTAEGVETVAQADDLTAIGSDHLQGFRYSSPASAAEIEQMLSGAVAGG